MHSPISCHLIWWARRFDFASQKFTTQIGPIHANFVLLDEINRSNAKTQSAMLEAMAEGATTIGGQRIALPKPFMAVIATENPIEEEGTFNLPEAQMDRFMMKAVMTYPSPDEEARMLAMLTRRGSDMIGPDTITGERISVSDVDFLRKAARRVHVPTRSCVMRSISPPRHEVPAPAPSRDCHPWCVWAPRRAPPSP